MNEHIGKFSSHKRPCREGKYQSMDNTKTGIKRGNSPKKMKRSPDERPKYTKRTHGNLSDTFQHSRRSFSIRRERM